MILRSRTIRLDRRPRPVADHGSRLVRLEERAHEAHRVVVRAQEVRVRNAARQNQAVVVALAGLLDRLVHLERVGLVQVLEALDLAAVE